MIRRYNEPCRPKPDIKLPERVDTIGRQPEGQPHGEGWAGAPDGLRSTETRTASIWSVSGPTGPASSPAWSDRHVLWFTRRRRRRTSPSYVIRGDVRGCYSSCLGVVVVLLVVAVHPRPHLSRFLISLFLPSSPLFPSGCDFLSSVTRVLLHWSQSYASTGIRFKMMRSCEMVFIHLFLCLLRRRRPCTSAARMRLTQWSPNIIMW